MVKKANSNTTNAKIASHIHGRIRFKLHSDSRSHEAMEAIQKKLNTLEGIHDVRLNHNCGSVIVNYDKGQHSMAGILRFLEDLDVIVESVGHLPTIDTSNDAAFGKGQTTEFIAAINDLNVRIQQSTGLPFNLKLALPLTFLAAGVWSIGKSGLMIEKVPGWLFVWLAFDIFVKMHSSHNQVITEPLQDDKI